MHFVKSGMKIIVKIPFRKERTGSRYDKYSTGQYAAAPGMEAAAGCVRTGRSRGRSAEKQA